jgi:hypothetical protein
MRQHEHGSEREGIVLPDRLPVFRYERETVDVRIDRDAKVRSRVADE